jgi:TRAP-type C4-dicarboxylate transport system permease large subunit
MTGKQINYLARHAAPMFFLMVAAVLIVYFVPELITWLPRQMGG